MFRWIFFIFLSCNLFSMELYIQGAKQDFQKYSTLHIKDSKDFLCEEMINDFDEVTKIVCAFSQKPSVKIRKIQNDFFKIDTVIKPKAFFIVITPFKKMKLYPMIFNLDKDERIFDANIKLSKHWMIVGYEQKIPFINKNIKSDVSINFPYESSLDNLPYVGGLDIQGNPVYIKKTADVSDYLKIKKYYKDEKYELCLELINEIVKHYPNTLFRTELLLYKIRCLAQTQEYDDVIESSKVFLREYSSDESVPEVLSLISEAYVKVGQDSDADYFFDRLFSEHENSVFAKWGYIYKGEMYEASGGASKAIKYYQKALNETADLDVAVMAAFKLAHIQIERFKKKQALKYIEKIIKAKPEFFVKHLDKSMNMMYFFADNQEYKIAAQMAKALYDQMNETYDVYEEILKDRGVWLSKTDDKKDALNALNKYLKDFSGGYFENEVIVAKDSLFFDDDDKNITAKIQNYNELIKTYKDDSIGEKAIYEKAKFLMKNQMYSDVLKFKDSILALDEIKFKDKDELVKQAAIGAMKQALKAKECYEVLHISNDYNITLSDSWDDGIYDCAMKGADFTLAKETSSKNLKSKDLQQRKKWLYRYIKVDFATGNYSELVEASKDLITLIENDKNSKYREVYRVLFDTYDRLENNQKMLEAILKIQKEFGLSYKDIERYVAVLTIGANTNDDNLVISYGKKIMKIQKESDSYAQSPFVEFTLYQAYIDRQDYLNALEVIKSLDKRDLSKSQRARQKYLLGSVLDKLWRNKEAIQAYNEAIKTDPKSPWAQLAKDAKAIQ